MITNRLLEISVLAGYTFTGFAGLPTLAADRQTAPAPAPAAPAAAKPATRQEARRPLAAKDVWGHDYAHAAKQAKALKRPVLLHFHATWCGPCQHMEQNVLNSNDVLEEVHSRCVGVKVDSDRQPNLVEQFSVTALPCDVFVSHDGKVLKVNEGALSADQYKALISSVARPKSSAPSEVNVASN